jgi:hypothetical protein
LNPFKIICILGISNIHFQFAKAMFSKVTKNGLITGSYPPATWNMYQHSGVDRWQRLATVGFARKLFLESGAGKPRDHGITIYLMIVRNIHLAK